VISAEREGHRTSKLHADRIIFQADPFASIEGFSKDKPGDMKSMKLTPFSIGMFFKLVGISLGSNIIIVL
jgi:hypothetical protein